MHCRESFKCFAGLHWTILTQGNARTYLSCPMLAALRFAATSLRITRSRPNKLSAPILLRLQQAHPRSFFFRSSVGVRVDKVWTCTNSYKQMFHTSRHAAPFFRNSASLYSVTLVPRNRPVWHRNTSVNRQDTSVSVDTQAGDRICNHKTIEWLD